MSSTPPPRTPPVRRTPLDDLKPKDFLTGSWPKGPMRVPQKLRTYGLTDEQGKALLNVISEYRDLIVAYENYVAHNRDITHEQMAARVGVSGSTLRALRRGAQFPSFRVHALLRTLVPSREQQDAELGLGQIDPR